MDMLAFAALAVCPTLMIVAALHDVATMRIPNWISLALVAAFLPAALLAGLSPIAIAIHLGVAVAALVVGMGLFALRWLGGGDAKLMAAGCLWLGLDGAALFVLWTAIVGGLFSIVLLGARRWNMAIPPGAPGWAMRLMEPKGDIPYGVAIAAGALLAFPQADLWRAYAGL